MKETEAVHVAGPLKPDEEFNPFFSRLSQPTQKLSNVLEQYLELVPKDRYVVEARHDEVVVMEDKESAGQAGAWAADESSEAVKEAVRLASEKGLEKVSPPRDV